MKRALLALVALTLIGVPASGADFTASSPTPASFAAAADFNTVAVAITNPGSPLRGTVSLQATASSDRGIDRVRFQSSPAGAGTWTDACEDSSAPYSCNWNTAGVADGSRDVRAVAFDQAGYQRNSVVAARVIDNTLPAATLNDPGAWLQGSESLTATGSDALSGLAALAIEYRPAGGGSWTELCTGSSSPRNCTLPTATLPDGSYELRARAADAAGNVRNGTTLTRTVDNTAPTVSVPPPGALRGTVDIAISAADGAGTGIDSVTAQFRPAGGGGWSDVCTDTTAPYACTGLDSTQVPDGLYEARAVAVDETGLSTTSAVITVRVDNTAPATPTLANPGSPLRGSVALSGTATDGGSGIASWTVQYRLSSGGAWTDACSDTTSSFGCTWATTGVADGTYDLRARALDVAGNESFSSTITSRVIDNTAPSAASVLTANVSGGTTGQFNNGDWIRLTWTEQIAPASVLAGWTGASQAITVRVTDSPGNDRMDFYNAGNTVRLNLVNSASDLELGGNFVTTNKTFGATMVQTGAYIQITLGNPGGSLNRAGSGTMRWRPSASATDLAGNPGTTTQWSEPTPVDRDF
jgi:chitinase